jgi:aspartate beta-hydroxylase
MMEDFKEALSCVLELARPAIEGDRQRMTVDSAEAEKEKAAWEQRRKNVTAALIPGLKKIVDHEFGAGASDRIDRVAQMYQSVGRNEVLEDEGPGGRRYAPGYITGLEPALPFHDTGAYPWCAHLERHWKAIWQELQGCLEDESLWTPGAYQTSNEAYGKDWKIMGVFTADRWQDERRFAVTTRVLKQLEGVVPSEVFFARMPPRTSIAPHSDNLNYILTSHLPLDLEEGSCSITVGNEERYWKHGSMLVLDTCFIHSTKNESGRPRYIMVLRFWHPGLSDEERRAIHLSHQILAGSARQRQ